ncbi:HAD-IIIC family phosphatase [Aquiflexum sp.]|uniref:HAD-IIIC family phosphatase n=1 Tax=Aquiflexum sp. TaxID=1872584 RepID=UPI00359358D2
MDSIKLVIWDLDETFWKGTLSEESITPIKENLETVKKLTERGIINTIVSKNDFEMAKSKLVEIGIWDYFVFPAIEWNPKGILIKQIIENCQLRDTNVLFIDDNPTNLNEAKFHNANIHTKTPDFIPEILLHPAFKGKEDLELSRLKQYKVLEKKAMAKISYDSNREFLKDSNIQINIIQKPIKYKDRITELIGRANQLNFTKIRLDDQEVGNLLFDETLQNAAVWAKDRYGDYGIVGFYSYDPAANKFNHFVFSCRILNLGIPQYIYAKYNFPELEIVPEIAENLDHSHPDWISEFNFNIDSIDNRKKINGTGTTKILFAGGCEYDQMYFYLERNNIEVKLYVNYNTDQNIPVRPSHTETILAGLKFSATQKENFLNHPMLPFLDDKYFDSGIFDFTYDCLVYNPRMDYEHHVYEHKKDKFLISYGGYGNDFTDENDRDKIVEFFSGRKVTNINEPFLREFSEQFMGLGRITTEKFIKNLHEIRQNIPLHIPIILINCPEVKLSFHEFGEEMYQRFHEMNKAMDQFISESENTHLLDIRKIITHESHLISDLGHFQRKHYKDISLVMLQMLNSLIGEKVTTKLNLKSIVYTKLDDMIDLARKIKRQLVG